MRVTKGHSGNRRAHHALEGVRLSDCSNCKTKHARHKVCLECGFYKGNKVLEIKTKKELVKTIDTDNKKTDNKKMETDDNRKVSEAPVKKVMKKVQNKG